MSELPSTAPQPLPAGKLRRARAGRRVALGFIAAFVLCGAVGLFGIRTGTTSVSGAGYSMSLDYPATDRSDQPIHWVLTLRKSGGFTRPVDIGISQSYLDLLDVNDIEPSPSSSHDDGRFVVWTFDPPANGPLRVSLDGNIQLNAHFGAGADVAVLEGGRPVLSMHYRTWVAP